MKRSITEIADELGVSHTTVSRVLNNKPDVSEKTRKKVLSALNDISYEGGTRKKLGENIGLIAPRPTVRNFYVQTLFAAVHDMATTIGFDVKLIVPDEVINHEHGMRAFMLRKNLMGVIVVSNALPHQTVVQLKEERIPHILINNTMCAEDGFNYVVSDVEGGIFKAFSYLTELGHKDFAFVDFDGITPLIEKVRASVTAAAAHHNVEMRDDRYIRTEGTPQEHKGEIAFRRILSLEPRPTVVFALNTNFAVGILEEARKQGVRVPDDISLCVFGDNVLLEYLTPPVTVVRQDLYELGKLAVQELHRATRDFYDGTRIAVPTEFIIRTSCAEPKA